MSSLPMPAGRLIPQRPPMLLLDQLLACTAQEGTVEAVIAPGNLFRLPDGTIHPAALVELMAQAYAAVHGYQDHLAGKPVGIGFLAGIRHAAMLGAARVGDRIQVTVRRTDVIDRFALAQARVTRGEETLAEGELTLFIPPTGADSP